MSGFDPALLAILREAEEAEITTRGTTIHRTIIWPVVDDRGRVFVRSVRGPRGRWYRDALADPAVSLAVGEARLELIPG